MKFKYEDLEIWKIALELIKAVYALLNKFPTDEKYDLVSHGKRAVTSIALNIAEGSGRHTDRDFSVFINRSITSLLEVDAVFKIGINMKYITDDNYKPVSALVEKEYFKLIAFNKSLKINSNRRKRYSDMSPAIPAPPAPPAHPASPAPPAHPASPAPPASPAS